MGKINIVENIADDLSGAKCFVYVGSDDLSFTGESINNYLDNFKDKNNNKIVDFLPAIGNIKEENHKVGSIPATTEQILNNLTDDKRKEVEKYINKLTKLGLPEHTVIIAASMKAKNLQYCKVNKKNKNKTNSYIYTASYFDNLIEKHNNFTKNFVDQNQGKTLNVNCIPAEELCEKSETFNKIKNKTIQNVESIGKKGNNVILSVVSSKEANNAVDIILKYFDKSKKKESQIHITKKDFNLIGKTLIGKIFEKTNKIKKIKKLIKNLIDNNNEIAKKAFTKAIVGYYGNLSDEQQNNKDNIKKLMEIAKTFGITIKTLKQQKVGEKEYNKPIVTMKDKESIGVCLEGKNNEKIPFANQIKTNQYKEKQKYKTQRTITTVGSQLLKEVKVAFNEHFNKYAEIKEQIKDIIDQQADKADMTNILKPLQKDTILTDDMQPISDKEYQIYCEHMALLKLVFDKNIKEALRNEYEKHEYEKYKTKANITLPRYKSLISCVRKEIVHNAKYCRKDNTKKLETLVSELEQADNIQNKATESLETLKAYAKGYDLPATK